MSTKAKTGTPPRKTPSPKTQKDDETKKPILKGKPVDADSDSDDDVPPKTTKKPVEEKTPTKGQTKKPIKPVESSDDESEDESPKKTQKKTTKTKPPAKPTEDSDSDDEEIKTPKKKTTKKTTAAASPKKGKKAAAVESDSESESDDEEEIPTKPKKGEIVYMLPYYSKAIKEENDALKAKGKKNLKPFGSWGIFGDTKMYKEEIKGVGATFNGSIEDPSDESKKGGWLLSVKNTKKVDEMKALLKKINSGKIQPTEPTYTRGRSQSPARGKATTPQKAAKPKKGMAEFTYEVPEATKGRTVTITFEDEDNEPEDMTVVGSVKGYKGDKVKVKDEEGNIHIMAVVSGEWQILGYNDHTIELN